MNKKQLIAAAAKQCGMTQKQTEGIVQAVFDCIAQALSEEQRVSISGFGTFEPKERTARMSRVPGAEQMIRIPSARTAVFRPSKQLKEKINQNETG